MTQTNSKKGSLASGYILKGVPKGLYSIVKNHAKTNRFTKNSRKNVLPVVVVPSDFWVSSIVNPRKGRQKMAKKGVSEVKNVASPQRFRKSYIKSKYANLDATNMKEISEKMSRKFTSDWGNIPCLVPVMLPSKFVRGRVIACSNKKEDVTVGGYGKSTRGEYWHFFDDIDSQRRSYRLRCSLSVYENQVIIENKNCKVYSPFKLKINTDHDLLVFKWQTLVEHEGVTIDMPIYYCFDKREIKIDYSDMYDMMAKVNDFDVISPNTFFDKQTTALILFNTVYCVLNEPVFNTVIFGGTRLGKSKTLEVFANMFNEVVSAGSSQTIKGLTGSFYHDKPQSGSLMQANFISLNDELFRTGLQTSSQNPDANHILSLLNGLMELLEHGKKVAPSGKYTRLIHFDKSFLATSNTSVQGFREFENAFNSDPAPFNRLTMLLIPKEVEERIRDSPKIPSGSYYQVFRERIEKSGLSVTGLAKMFKYMRHEILQKNRVIVDSQKSSLYMKKTNYCHKDFEKWEKFHALVKVVAIFNYAFRNKRPFPLKKGQYIKATDKDYRDAVEYLNRITNDFKQIMRLP